MVESPITLRFYRVCHGGLTLVAHWLVNQVLNFQAQARFLATLKFEFQFMVTHIKNEHQLTHLETQQRVKSFLSKQKRL